MDTQFGKNVLLKDILNKNFKKQSWDPWLPNSYICADEQPSQPISHDPKIQNSMPKFFAAQGMRPTRDDGESAFLSSMNSAKENGDFIRYQTMLSQWQHNMGRPASSRIWYDVTDPKHFYKERLIRTIKNIDACCNTGKYFQTFDKKTPSSNLAGLPNNPPPNQPSTGNTINDIKKNPVIEYDEQNRLAIEDTNNQNQSPLAIEDLNSRNQTTPAKQNNQSSSSLTLRNLFHFKSSDTTHPTNPTNPTNPTPSIDVSKSNAVGAGKSDEPTINLSKSNKQFTDLAKYTPSQELPPGVSNNPGHTPSPIPPSTIVDPKNLPITYEQLYTPVLTPTGMFLRRTLELGPLWQVVHNQYFNNYFKAPDPTSEIRQYYNNIDGPTYDEWWKENQNRSPWVSDACYWTGQKSTKTSTEIKPEIMGSKTPHKVESTSTPQINISKQKQNKHNPIATLDQAEQILKTHIPTNPEDIKISPANERGFVEVTTPDNAVHLKLNLSEMKQYIHIKFPDVDITDDHLRQLVKLAVAAGEVDQIAHGNLSTFVKLHDLQRYLRAVDKHKGDTDTVAQKYLQPVGDYVFGKVGDSIKKVLVNALANQFKASNDMGNYMIMDADSVYNAYQNNPAYSARWEP